jgi:ankyrin repeat protein
MEQGYLAQVQALIDQKWKENPEEMKRVMAEIEAKEKAKKEKPKVETPKQVSFDPQLTQELIEELNKSWDDVDITKVQDLIERGADLKAKNEDGQTPLHVASYRNHIETAKFLIELGADLEAEDDTGWTPLHWASDWNNIELAQLLIDAGADVMAKVGFGDRWTPLHRASCNRALEIVKLLIEAGADVEAKDDRGKTPLDVVRSNEIRDLLEKYMK